MTQPTIEPNMTLEQAARKAAEIFRWYEQLHAAKPDMEKAKRNAEFAEMLERALTAQAGEQIDDAKRLDYLDARNAAKNLRHGTKYGWQLNENCNRIALEDHGWPPLKVREAIDAAIAAAKDGA